MLYTMTKFIDEDHIVIDDLLEDYDKERLHIWENENLYIKKLINDEKFMDVVKQSL